MEVIQSDDHDLEGRWYHSPKDLDLFIWKDEHQTIIKQQLSFNGLIAEWNIVEGARTGAVTESHSPRKVKGSDTIQYHDQINLLVLDQAKQICEFAEALSERDKNQCSKNWEDKAGRGLARFSGLLRKLFR